MGKHSEKGGTTAQHPLHRWAPADAAARLALTVASTDRLKLAWQTDDASLWVLVDHALVASESGWKRIDGGTRVGPTLTGAANTLTLDQGNSLFGVSHGSATDLTVPPNASVEFPIGTTMVIYQAGAGVLSLVEGGGVTILREGSLDFRAQSGAVTLIKLATDTWFAVGALDP